MTQTGFESNNEPAVRRKSNDFAMRLYRTPGFARAHTSQPGHGRPTPEKDESPTFAPTRGLAGGFLFRERNTGIPIPPNPKAERTNGVSVPPRGPIYAAL